MLFNSVHFVFFFPIIIILYFAAPYKWRWLLLLIASYYFYMCWKAEYAVLIVGSTVIDYFASLQMEKETEQSKRKKWLYLSLVVNLGVLFGFKYFNFFSSNVNAFFASINLFYNIPAFDVLLPVGISFYTFQSLSYTIDVYNKKIEAEKHFGIFALYVSFFPQLVAGPIERATHLLPQFRQNFDFEYQRVVDGLKMMAWGFFLKLVIADRLAPMVNTVFNKPEEAFGMTVLVGTIFFAFQIFCDFAGYSSIAIGAAKVMGYDLMENFRRPYFSTSIREFWQRWHISLSTWFRDYVYIPLGGNRVVKWRWYYNLFITFFVSGIWHGANWTFLVWGALHGFYLVFAIITEDSRQKMRDTLGISKIPALDHFLQVVVTLCLAWFAWIFFRANSITDAFTLISHLFMSAPAGSELIKGVASYQIILGFFFIILLETIHWFEEYKKYQPMYSPVMWVRWTAYVAIILITLGFGVYTSNDFIYFQF